MVTSQVGTASTLYMVVTGTSSLDHLLVAPVMSTAATTLVEHLDAWDSWASYTDKPSLHDLEEEARAATIAAFLADLSAGGDVGATHPTQQHLHLVLESFLQSYSSLPKAAAPALLLH